MIQNNTIILVSVPSIAYFMLSHAIFMSFIIYIHIGLLNKIVAYNVKYDFYHNCTQDNKLFSNKLIFLLNE